MQLPGVFPRARSFLGGFRAPCLIVCKLDLANRIRSRFSREKSTGRIGSVASEQERINFSTIHRRPLCCVYYKPVALVLIRYLSLGPSVDCERLARSSVQRPGPIFAPRESRARCAARGRDYRVRHPPATAARRLFKFAATPRRFSTSRTSPGPKTLCFGTA